MSAFDPGGPAYQILLEMKGTLARVEAKLQAHIDNPCAVCKLEKDVDALSVAHAGTAGERRAYTESRDKLRTVAAILSIIIAALALTINIIFR